MNSKTSLEMIADTVEEAVEKGLDQLGVSRDKVDVEVLDEGSSGLFGIGERESRVRLTVKGTGSKTASSTLNSDSEVENTMEIARTTVLELLEHMSISANVSARLGESDDRDSNPPILVEVTGNDLSLLIGRNAETLNALQIVTRMIVGKEIGHSAHLIVDVEGYRDRRESNLRQLAQRMASQALHTGKQQALEPMTPAERRIIHIELRENDDVVTESAGQDPKRNVVIIPKEHL
jgi:spoIIIJ-associated protein